jgi:hypothetical protein
VTVCIGAGRANGSPAPRTAGLAFTRLQGDVSSVWIANADGSRAHRLTHGAFGQLSADGRWLAYQFLARPARGAYVVPVAGGAPRRLGEAVYAWSPDGSRLAFATKSALKLFDPVTNARSTLLRAPDISNISFAPNGRALVYDVSKVRGASAELHSDVFTVRFSDRRVRRLTDDGRSGEPVWGPHWIAYRHYGKTKWPQIGGTWFMLADGRGKHLFAPGDQDPRRAHYGLEPLEFSRDGRRLLACTAAEFDCSPVTFFVATKNRHVFSVGEFPSHKHALMAAEDLSADGRRLLVWIGSVDGAAPDDIYEMPFSGGRPHLVAHNAISAGWRN